MPANLIQTCAVGILGGAFLSFAACDHTPDYRIPVNGVAPIWGMNASECLALTGDTFNDGDEVDVLALNDSYALVSTDGQFIPISSLESIPALSQLPMPPRTGTLQINTTIFQIGSSGCLEDTTDPLSVTDVVDIYGRAMAQNYKGVVITTSDLKMVHIREVDSDGWVYPWHSSVQMLKDTGSGYIIGGGVIIDEKTILTVSHLGADETWCYSKEPITGTAWDAGLVTCNNIAGPAVNDPDGVDISLVTLIDPEPGPFATLRTSNVTVGEAFFTSKWGQLERNVFKDSTVVAVSNANANCLPWPALSSFTAADLIVAGGDSGGPAWIGDEVVGLVHGEACSTLPQPHVFIHTPAAMDFITNP